MSKRIGQASLSLTLTKAGLAAEAIAPGKRTYREHNQAKRHRKVLALIKEKETEKTKEKKQKELKESRIKMSIQGITKYKGIAKLAYQIKYFWAIEDSDPLQFESGLVALDAKYYKPLRALAIRLCKRCLKEDIFADRAVWLECMLLDPEKTRQRDLMASCRELADLVLAKSRG